MNNYKLLAFEDQRDQTNIMLIKNGIAFQSLNLEDSDSWYEHTWGLIPEWKIMDSPWLKSVVVLDEWSENE